MLEIYWSITNMKLTKSVLFELIDKEFEEQSKKRTPEEICRKLGYKKYKDFLKTMNALERAKAGELFDKKEDNKKQSRREYRDEIHPGWIEFQRLSKGIVEKNNQSRAKPIKIKVKPVSISSNDELEEACADGKIGNRLHSKSGELTGYDDNHSWSLERQGCGQAKMKPGSKKQYFTTVKCGRAARKQGKNIRCWDGKNMDANPD